MNERIKELAKQAHCYANGHSMFCHERNINKFAESVVERIDLILASEYLDCVGENDKKSQFRIDRLRNRIKAYFGVEE